MSGLSPQWPLQLCDEQGYKLLSSHHALVIQNFKMLLLTSPGERVMELDFGVGLKRFLFEPDVEEVRSSIHAAIEAQVEQYMKHIILLDVEVQSASNNGLIISVYFDIPPLNVENESVHIQFDPRGSVVTTNYSQTNELEPHELPPEEDVLEAVEFIEEDNYSEESQVSTERLSDMWEQYTSEP